MALVLRAAAPLKPELRLVQAVSEYEAILTDMEKTAFRALRAGQPPTTSDVMKVTADIDRNNSHRWGRRCVGPRLTSILESVQQFTTIVDIVVGGSQCLIASAIWGTMKMTLEIALGFSSYFDNLSLLYMQIGRTAPRLQDYGVLYTGSIRLQKALCQYFCTVVDLCRKSVLFVRKRMLAQLSTAVLKPFKTEFGSLQAELNAQADIVLEEASLASKQELRLEHREASAFRAWRSTQSAQDIVEAQNRKFHNMKSHFLNKCSTFDYEAAWRRARKGGTSTWLFGEHLYQQWTTSGISCVLWFTGKLGFGKTVATANMVQELMIKYPNALVAYFFCTHDNAESLKAPTVVGSLVRQLLDHVDPKVFDISEFSASAVLDETAATDHLLHLLPTIDRQYFVVVDGLDECPKVKYDKVLQSLSKLVKSNNRFNLFCSSRPEIDVSLEKVLQPQYRISMPAENPEIAQYIVDALEHQIEEGNLVLGDSMLILNIRDALLQGSQGMFLWVVFQIEALCLELTDDGILSALKRLPKNLPETFDRVLKRLDAEKTSNPALRKGIFALMVAAQRPLTLDELREALGVTPGEPTWMPDKQINNIRRAVASCGSLLVIDEEDEGVHFAHHSVRQYITSISDLDLAQYHLSFAEAELIMGEICVTYLNYGIFDTEVAKSSNHKWIQPQDITDSVVKSTTSQTVVRRAALKLLRTKTPANVDLQEQLAQVARETKAFCPLRPADHPFQQYAQAFWLLHTRRFDSADQGAYRLWLRLIDNRIPVAEVPWAPESWSHLEPKFITWAVENDNEALLQKVKDELIHGEHDPLESPWPGGSLLNALAKNCARYDMDSTISCWLLELPQPFRDYKVMQLLVTQCNKMIAFPSGNQQKLRLHSKGGRYSFRYSPNMKNKLLLWNYTPTNDPSDRTILSHSASEGWLPVAEFILRSAWGLLAETDRNGATFLMQAARAGQTEIVQLLFRQSLVEINAKDSEDEMTSLSWAAREGHYKVVDALLSQPYWSIDVNARDRYGMTALMHATQSGSVRCVELLLAQSSIDINATAFSGWTVLYYAARHSSLEIAKMLLQQPEIEVNKKNSLRLSGETLLMWAAKGNRPQMVEILLTHAQIDVNAMATSNGWTALHYAMAGFNRRTIEVLLDSASVDINIRNDDMETPEDLARRYSLSDNLEALELYKVRRTGTVAPKEQPVLGKP